MTERQPWELYALVGAIIVQCVFTLVGNVPDVAPWLLALLAIGNREVGYTKVRTLLADRFQRDVLSDLEFRLSWVYTVIKSAPMVGLLGTVVGMMGAFAKINTQSEAGSDNLAFAGDIMLALITTACGLTIAIPLVLCTAGINVRIRKLEDLVGAGLTRFLETFRTVAK